MTLKKRLGSSTAWMSLAASGNSAISFIIFIVLSRILTPSDIGLVAFALIVVEIGKIIVNAGFSQAVVQKPEWDDVYASTCFYLNIIFSIVVTLVVIFIAAPLIGHYYQAQAEPIVKVLSIIFFIEGLKAVHEGKLKREFAFKVIAIRTILAGLIPGAVGIYLALHNFGVWALVWQQLLNQIVVTVLTLITAKWMPRFVFSFTQAKHLLAFSSPLMLSQLISNISSKIFELLIGIIIGPAALGFYRVGGRALYILQDIILKPFEHTALSALSRVNGVSQQARATVRMVRMSSYLTFPIFFGAAAVAPEFITLAFGEKWAESGNIMTILAIGIAPQIVGLHVNAALTASDNSRFVMLLAIIALIINCSLGALTVPLGLTATAWGFSFRSYLIAGLSLFFFRYIFDISCNDMLKNLAPSFIASTIMFAVVFVSKSLFENHLPAALNIIVLCAIGAISYMLLMIILFKKETKNFFTESIDIAPSNVKPYIGAIQRLINLT